MLYCYFGHHKCASTWIVQLIHDISSVCGFRVYEKQITFMDDPYSELIQKDIDFYICQNSIYEKINNFKNYKGFHVIRDPRDIVVSGYFSHLYTHSVEGWEGLELHREELKNLDKAAGMMKEIEFSEYFLNQIYSWNYSNPNILELKMEELTSDNFNSIKEILIHLNLYTSKKTPLLSFKLVSLYNRIIRKIGIKSVRIPIKLNDNYITYLVELRSFKKMSKGRNISEENVKSHYRKGLANDWKNHLDSTHLAFFNKKYPNIIKKLGYSD